MINVAIIGYGLSGTTFHAPVISVVPELSLHSIVSSQVEKVREDYPGVRARTDYYEVLNDKEVQLVVITVPTSLHAQYAAQALKAGKHVVVEKPFVSESKIGRELAALARSNNLILSVYQNRRWDNGFLTLKKCIEAGELGEIYSYEAHFDRFRPEVKKGKWREQDLLGSGILFDLGAHLIDQALCLFGAPDSVFCDTQCQREGAVVQDYFHIILSYGMRRVVLRAGSLVGVPGPVLEVHGTNGSFLKRSLDPQEECLKGGGRPRSLGWGLDEDSAKLWKEQGGQFISTAIETVPGCYDEYYRLLAGSISHGHQIPVTAEEGAEVISIVETCLLSSKQGKTVPYRP